MDNFTFHPTTKILFGRDTENAVGAEIMALGKKVLLHYGTGSIKKSGLFDKVVASLQALDIEFVELGGVVPNPRLSLVREGIELCHRENIQAILAVGGGSVIDSAKAIAFGAVSDKDVWDEFFVKGTPVTQALAIGTILTIPAAGSEASPHNVVTDEENDRKLAAHGAGMLPAFSILNPELTMTLPAYQTACGAADMFAHILERYFTDTPHVDFTDHLCEGALRSILKNTPKVLAEPDNYDYRAELMLAGMIAHNDVLGLGRAGDWMTHDIEHELSALWDVTHGEGLAALFPSWIQYAGDNNPAAVPRLVRFAEEVFHITTGSDEEKIQAAVAALKSWFAAIGLKTKLTQFEDFDESKIETMAAFVIPAEPRGSLIKLTQEDVANIYRLAR